METSYFDVILVRFYVREMAQLKRHHWLSFIKAFKFIFPNFGDE